MKNKVVVRLQPPIQESKYAEILTEMANRNIAKPVVYSTVLSNGNIATITFSHDSFDASSSLLSDLGIPFDVISVMEPNAVTELEPVSV